MTKSKYICPTCDTQDNPIWKPLCDENGEYIEEFYTVNELGYINYKELVIFKEDINLIYKIGNVFKTKEAAQRMADRRKRIGIFENKMMEFADGYRYTKGPYNNCYIVWFQGSNKWIITNSCVKISAFEIYMNQKNAQKAVDWANKHYPEGL